MNHIFKYGITSAQSKNKNEDYKSIGDIELINRRKISEQTKGRIPFYFSTKTPMLYVAQKKYKFMSKNIIYCVSSIEKLNSGGISFEVTDGHAADYKSKKYDHKSTEYNIKNPEGIKQVIDLGAITDQSWGADPEIKRKKQAECLINSNDIPLSLLENFIVENQDTKYQLMNLIKINKAPYINIIVNPDIYFKFDDK